jgi:cytochrome b561
MVADALFALLLAGLLTARCRWWLKYSPPTSPADIRLFSRGLSRSVYLVLYLIIGAQLMVNIAGALQGGAGAARDLGMLKPTSQAFLAYGLIALVLIRVFAYLTWRRYRLSFERGPVRPPANPARPSFLMRRVLEFLNSPQ